MAPSVFRQQSLSSWSGVQCKVPCAVSADSYRCGEQPAHKTAPRAAERCLYPNYSAHNCKYQSVV